MISPKSKLANQWVYWVHIQSMGEGVPTGAWMTQRKPYPWAAHPDIGANPGELCPWTAHPDVGANPGEQNPWTSWQDLQTADSLPEHLLFLATDKCLCNLGKGPCEFSKPVNFVYFLSLISFPFSLQDWMFQFRGNHYPMDVNLLNNCIRFLCTCLVCNFKSAQMSF